MNAHPLLQCSLMRMQAGEGWQQGWVNIEQAPLIVANKALCEDAHEARQHHQIGRVSINALGQRSVEGFPAAGESRVIDHRRRNTLLRSGFEALGIRPVADDGSNAHRQVAATDRCQQRLHVAATTGDENDDGFHRLTVVTVG